MMQGKKYSVVYTEIWYQFLIGNVRHVLFVAQVTGGRLPYQFLIGNVRHFPKRDENAVGATADVSIPHR